MINWLNNFFKSEEQTEGLYTPEGAIALFVLKFQDLTIGYLSHADNKWVFEYSDEFKKQNEIDVLVDFPAMSQKYESSHLWPFFAHRIPGLGQPQIQQIIKNENLNPKNEIDLLKRFGQRSITNPFELTT